MYNVLNILTEYKKNITSYAFLLVFKIMESCQCILDALTKLVDKENKNQLEET